MNQTNVEETKLIERMTTHDIYYTFTPKQFLGIENIITGMFIR